MIVAAVQTPAAALASTLDALCKLFDEELERQENVLRLCRGQGEAARAHDVQIVEARTAAITLLLDEAVRAEKNRVRVLTEVVAHYDLPIERQTLTHLIAVVPDPWRGRMLDFQTTIKAVLAETRIVVRANASYMRRALRVVDHSVALVIGAATDELYRPSRSRTHKRLHEPLLVNAQG